MRRRHLGATKAVSAERMARARAGAGIGVGETNYVTPFERKTPFVEDVSQCQCAMPTDVSAALRGDRDGATKPVAATMTVRQDRSLRCALAGAMGAPRRRATSLLLVGDAVLLETV